MKQFITNVSLPDGSGGSPAITFSGDTNTGIYRIASDTLGIATGGSERCRLSSGLLSVGTGNSTSRIVLGGNITISA